MSYKLNTSGLAATVLACVLPDDDGVVRDIKPGNTVDVHSNVTVGSSSWNGVSRSFFRTSGSGSLPYGVKWTGTQPATSSGPGLWFFIAAAKIGPERGTVNPVPLVNVGASGSNKTGLLLINSVLLGVGNVSVGYYSDDPVPGIDGTAKLSVGGIYQANATTTRVFSGLHGGTLSALRSPASPGSINMGSPALQIGGRDGSGYVPMDAHIVVIGQGVPTLADFQAMHADWFGTLLQVTATTTRRIKVTGIHSDAIGQTVAGTIFAAASGSRIHGAEVGVFSGRTIVSDGAGGGAFTINAADVGGSGLSLGTGPVVLMKSPTGGSVGVYPATVVDEV